MSRFPSRLFAVPFLLTVALLALAVLLFAGPKASPDASRSVVAIGDVHGDYDDFVAVLQRVGLIDAQRHWTGGNSTFVQVGDLIDRGPKPREVLDLMMVLQEQASKADGQVVSLLGNHEVMNIMGDLRYVTPGNYASFADGNSEKRQKEALQKYMAWRKGHSALLAELTQPVLPETEAEWLTRHPLGFIEHREAYGPKGIYGKWLRQHNAIARIGEVIFLHGGISPDLSSTPIDGLNAQVRDEIRQYDEIRQSLTDDNILLPFFTLQEAIRVVEAELLAERKQRVSPDQARQARILQFGGLDKWLCVREDGPVWFRGYDTWTDDDGGPKVDKILAAYKATNVVVGHTVQKTAHIRLRFGGRIMLIDTGMLSSYYPGGKPSALGIAEDGTFTANYLDQQEVLRQGKSAQTAPK